MRNLILIYAKPHIDGVSKTRLSKDLNIEDSMRLSKSLLEKNINLVKNSNFNFLLSTSKEEYVDILEKKYGVKTILQRGYDLGSKMYYSIYDGLKHYDSVTIMGADVVDFEKNMLLELESKIKSYDMVVSNTLDGGYSLISLKEAYKTLFIGKTFSHNKVFTELIDSANKINLETYILKRTMDIDDINSLASYIGGIRTKKIYEDEKLIHFSNGSKTFVFYKKESKGSYIDKICNVKYDII
ncbi:DUF2064 domain-containing protein [Citroniella saccharovorans]|uniref:DUF2064 domain-containing protein n=1 Tax=Citroniella saccharovorans TaxID=2053367 RepID=A0AAW9MNC9_9FIRM|nr:DUF2064 domain-containing protein [Citroniella saccharovorans]MEB3429038.1 DUF2064 domain-containing protein [Citroniella saccharovorans]